MLAYLIAALAGAEQLPPTPETFGDWIVGCDNRRDCEAIGFADPYDPDDTPMIGVIIDRRADANARPNAYIDPRFFEAEDYSGEIVADGKATGLRLDQDGGLVGDGIAFSRVIAASKSVKLVSPKGQTLGIFRTNGASAALRWMDDRQKRVGTVTALVASGVKPAAAVPPPPKLPTIPLPPISTAPPRKLSETDLETIRKRFDLCDEPRGETEYYRIDASNSIAIVNCWNGPYQSDGIIVLVPDAGDFRLAPIDPSTKADLETPAPEHSRLISPGYDTERRLLWMEYRGRGLNDCGAGASWAWDGTAFRLASYSALDECRGVTSRIPYWQTTNAPASADD